MTWAVAQVALEHGLADRLCQQLLWHLVSWEDEA